MIHERAYLEYGDNIYFISHRVIHLEEMGMDLRNEASIAELEVNPSKPKVFL